MAAPKSPDHNAEPLTWDHDIDDPKVVTAELTKPFPKEALEAKEGFTYVKYPMMIRRLIRATGNRFSTRLVGQQSEPFGKTSKGQERVLLRAWVELDIPVLGSARVHEGVQIAFVGTGEDMYKGAISDAIKKAAQSYGVGIELTGADAEWYISQRVQQAADGQPSQPTPIRTDPNRERVNKALHAKVSHDSLHAWAESKGKQSLNDMTTKDLTDLETALKNPANLTRFRSMFDTETANG